LYEKKHNKKELQKWFCNFFRPFQCLSIEEMCSDDEKNRFSQKLAQQNSNRSLYEWKYRGLYLGRCLWDEIIWNKKFTVENEAEILEAKEKLCRYLAASVNIIKRYNIVAGFFTHTSGIASGIPLRLLLNKKIPVWASYGSLSTFQRLKYEGNHGFVTIPGSITRKAYEQGLRNKNCLRKAARFTENIYQPKRLKNKKPQWLIALHVFSDTPNTFQQNIFRDYYEWYKKTIELTSRIKNVDWTVKAHPHSHLYLGDYTIEKIKNDLKGKNNLCLWSERKKHRLKNMDFDKDLGKFDGVVTCSGSIALQFLILGKPAITCAEGYYSQLNLLKPCKSLSSYKKALESCTKKKISAAQSQRARLVYYLIFGEKRNSLTYMPNLSFETFSLKNLVSEIPKI